MHHVPIILAGVAAQALYRHVKDQNRRKKEAEVRPEWTGEIRVPRPIREIRREIDAHLRRRGFTLHSKRRQSSLYQRGDRGITRIPYKRDVRWTEVPIHLIVVYQVYAGVTHVGFCVLGSPSTTFSPSVSGYFDKRAELELDAAIEHLNSGGSQQRSEPKPPSPPSDKTAEEDLKLLGLARGFSWEQLQAAYRAACRKYHPDRLVGVEPDVVKLAQEHFVRVKGAYERLRQRTPQPQVC